MKTIEELEVDAKKARQEADDAGGADANLNQIAEDAENVLAEAKSKVGGDIDYAKELEILNASVPQPRSEKEKAKFTIDKILERHPDLKDEMIPKNNENQDNLRAELLRNQVEGIIRQDSKTEEEVRFKMHFYDNKIVKTGNIHEDADNAIWLANKGRTRNAITEMQRNPVVPNTATGPGQKAQIDGVPNLSPEDVRRLTQAGLKQTAPGVWEGAKVKLVYDPKSKQWDQTFK